MSCNDISQSCPRINLPNLKSTLVLLSDEVDGDSLPAEPSSTSDTVDVVLAVGGQVVVDHKGDLENIFQ